MGGYGGCVRYGVSFIFWLVDSVGKEVLLEFLVKVEGGVRVLGLGRRLLE